MLKIFSCFLSSFFFFLNLNCALYCSRLNKSFIYCTELGVAPPSRPAVLIWAASISRPPCGDRGAQTDGAVAVLWGGWAAWADQTHLPRAAPSCFSLRLPRGGATCPWQGPPSSPAPPSAGTQASSPHPPAPTQPLCFLAAPMWKWPDFELPLTRVSKLPWFSHAGQSAEPASALGSGLSLPLGLLLGLWDFLPLPGSLWA